MTPKLASFLPAFLLAGCVGFELPGSARTADEPEPVQVASLVVGEDGLASGIPAAIQAFGPYTEADETAAPARVPTVLPRHLPQADAQGTAFAQRVSIAPDGRRLAIGTQQGERAEVQIITASRKDTERRVLVPGRFRFVGWADPGTVLVGVDRKGGTAVEAVDLATGARRTLARDAEGILSLTTDGEVVTADRSRRRGYDGLAVRQAGPPDEAGRVVLATAAGAERGVLVPYDCSEGFAAPIYEGSAFDGTLADTASGRYVGVWDEDGMRYLDPSLAYEMREVAASFPDDVSVWPIEFTRSPNTLLLYVSGPETLPSYYVLDRYAGALDLHVTLPRGE